MKAIEAPKIIEPWRIICAAQSEFMLVEQALGAHQ